MQIAIIGAGMMGANIAQTVALGEHDILLLDTEEQILRLALARISRGLDAGVRLNKITPLAARRARRRFRLTTDLEDCASMEVVIEAVYDEFDLKSSLLRALDEIVRPETVLATTTNTLSLTRLAAETQQPERVVGLHFCNPAHIMKLVEVIRGEATRQEIVDRALDLARKIGKTPVLVRDIPGWIVNRVSQAYLGEALALLDDNALDTPTIDRLMEAAGFPMGPFRLMDFLGVDTAFETTLAIYEATFHAASYRPSPRLQRMVDAGRIGRGKDRGFYEKK